jgi:hypothetical protein
MNERAGEWYFRAYLAAFVVIFAAFYPATYAIEDELNILSLSVAISKGTVFLDEAGIDLDADLLWNGRRISKYSPLHAALLVPAVATSWRAGFMITAGFALAGAFVVRGMLRRERMNPGWVALYFLCAGTWFYSRTLMAAVPASVMLLAGASLLLRDRSRPAAGGAALGIAGLLHPWMIPPAAAIAVAWWLAHAGRGVRPGLHLAAGALPCAAVLLVYNAYTTGHPLVNAYSVMGTQYGFKAEHIETYLPIYLASLLVMPLAGWAAFSPAWSRGPAIPLAVTTIIAMASIYYYRDGLGYGIAGLLPAQRFLLPASMLACLPAARWLAARGASFGGVWIPRAAFAAFVTGFTAVSFGHGAYLDAHAQVQDAITQQIPNGSHVIVGERAYKSFAPVLGTWQLTQVRDGHPPRGPFREPVYVMWLGPPGSHPPEGWMNQDATRVAARSWVWNRDVWIGRPVAQPLAATR